MRLLWRTASNWINILENSLCKGEKMSRKKDGLDYVTPLAKRNKIFGRNLLVRQSLKVFHCMNSHYIDEGERKRTLRKQERTSWKKKTLSR